MAITLTPFETGIKNFLDDMAKEDKAFATNYAKPNKSVEECCKYIYQEVDKSRKAGEKVVGCSADEIYGLALHYYDEDDIVVSGPKTQVVGVQQIKTSGESSESKPKKKRVSKKKTEPIAPESECVSSPDVVDGSDELPDELVIPLF